MNKRKRTSLCLERMRSSHRDWWGTIAEELGVTVPELEEAGLIADGKVTRKGEDYIDGNRVYKRPTLRERLSSRIAVWHRGRRIPVYVDDAGQQYYFYYKGDCVGCGAYEEDYESCVRSHVDRALDHAGSVDFPQRPGAYATLERMRKGEDGVERPGLYMLLTDRDLGIVQLPVRLGRRGMPVGRAKADALYKGGIVLAQFEMLRKGGAGAEAPRDGGKE